MELNYGVETYFHSLLATRTQESYLNSLNFYFLTCEIKMMIGILTSQGIERLLGDNPHKGTEREPGTW